MEPIKLFDSELRLMELVWENAPVLAKQLSLVAEKEIGWNKNTTYTILKKLVEKHAISRTEPNFICNPLVTREDVCRVETDSLIQKLFKGSRQLFFSSFQDAELSDEEVEALRKLIEKKSK
jgi:BlaI family penicillinase repressor